MLGHEVLDNEGDGQFSSQDVNLGQANPFTVGLIKGIEGRNA